MKGSGKSPIQGIIPAYVRKWGNQPNRWAQKTDIWTQDHQDTIRASHSITMFDMIVGKKRSRPTRSVTFIPHFVSSHLGQRLKGLHTQALWHDQLISQMFILKQSTLNGSLSKQLAFSLLIYASSTTARALQMSCIQSGWKTNSTEENVRSSKILDLLH